MIFQSPGDVLFSIGSFSIYYYGIILAVSCLVGIIISYKIYRYYNPDKNYDRIWDFSAYFLIAGILGARLYYCLLNPVYYFYNPLEILDFREGGLSIHGGLIAGTIALILLAKKNRLGILNTLDAFACGTAIAQSIGRWGNFFNSEAFGSPTNLPWKLYIPPASRPVDYLNFSYFHPTFLYESILDALIFILLLALMKKFAVKIPGITLFAYLILYSCARLLIESLRLDSALNINGIPIAQIVSGIFIIFGSAGIAYIIKKHCKKNKNTIKI